MSSSYDVHVWRISSYRGKRKTTYTVRWVVSHKKFQETFDTRKLAESFRAKLLSAAREGVPFDDRAGLPDPMVREQTSRSWYDHACAFVDMKWPHASAGQRRSIAETLANVTPALFSTERGAPDKDVLRRALRTWSFNTTARATEPTDDVRRAVRWVEDNSVRMSALTDAAVTRRALDQLALTLDGKAASPNTVSRKRAVFYGALRYAVELGYLDANPIDRIQWKTPKETETVDRRVVVNPAQARGLLRAVREISPPLEAFFACLYYAALRPSEALHLREHSCTLPATGWGELFLTGSTRHVGTAWTDSGAPREDRGLKKRANRDTRTVPACPELVRVLRRHLDEYGTGTDGRLFVVRAGSGQPLAAPYANPVSAATYARVWRAARQKALPASEVASPLAGRPYDLRHACVSLWLNAGVPATQVAEWAGHGVDVLMRVYAKCIYGQDEAARRRIEAALHDGDPRTDLNAPM